MLNAIKKIIKEPGTRFGLGRQEVFADVRESHLSDILVFGCWRRGRMDAPAVVSWLSPVTDNSAYSLFQSPYRTWLPFSFWCETTSALS